MVNSIKKGKTFERNIANFLTNIMQVKYHRVPCSGGFSTSQHTSGHQFNGDVFTENKKYKDIIIECKSYKEIKFIDIFNTNSKIHNWVNQAKTESKGNHYLVIFKINKIGIFLISNNFQYIYNVNYKCLIDEIVEYRVKNYNTIAFNGNEIRALNQIKMKNLFKNGII